MFGFYGSVYVASISLCTNHVHVCAVGYGSLKPDGAFVWSASAFSLPRQARIVGRVHKIRRAHDEAQKAPVRGIMSNVFAAHPWDKADRVKGATVFDRKLIYGNDHDKVEHLEDDGSKASYGKVERHKMHVFWRTNALKMLADTVRRGGKNPVVRKVQGKKAKEWPGDLGKHHAIVEEMISMGVLVLQQDKDTEVFAKVDPAKLAKAQQKFSAEANAANAAAAHAAHAHAHDGHADQAGGASAEWFMPSAAFVGARAGYIFKRDEQGTGYYRDGADATSAAAGTSAPTLPAGWVSGQTPEGYTYYWHEPTQTSSWEFPTGEPKASKDVPLAPLTAHALATDRGAAVKKIEEGSGALVSVDAATCTARVSGTAREVARACELLERKAGAVAFAARTAQQHAMPQLSQPAPAVGQKRGADAAASSYDFRSVAGFVEKADAAREALRQRTGDGSAPSGGGALAALASAYDDDSDDDEAQCE